MEAQTLILAMKARGMTQYSISAATGIPQGTISKLERGGKDILLSNYRKLEAAHARCLSGKEAGAIEQVPRE